MQQEIFKVPEKWKTITPNRQKVIAKHYFPREYALAEKHTGAKRRKYIYNLRKLAMAKHTVLKNIERYHGQSIMPKCGNCEHLHNHAGTNHENTCALKNTHSFYVTVSEDDVCENWKLNGLS